MTRTRACGQNLGAAARRRKGREQVDQVGHDALGAAIRVAKEHRVAGLLLGEAATGSAADAGARNGDGSVRLAGAGSADQNDVALLLEEAATAVFILS